jgi:hypothetical protein
MTPQFLMLILVVVPAWWLAYTVIGGKWPKPLVGGPVTWGMRWRSLVAMFVALFVGAGALELTRSLFR